MKKTGPWITGYRPLSLPQFFVACVLAPVLACGQDAQEASTTHDEAIAAGGVYTLVGKGSGKCVDVNRKADGAGRKLEIETCNGDDTQAFRIDGVASGKFRLIHAQSNMCLDVEGAGAADGTRVQVYPCNGTAAQSFAIEDAGVGYRRLVNPHSAKCVDVAGNASADGTPIQIYTCNGTDAQRFTFKDSSLTKTLPHKAEFRNPLNTGPDPFMTYYDGNYYLATTQSDSLRMWKAPSLGELLAAPATTIWQDSDSTRNRDIWAPSFYLINGHWYVYYTADDGIDEHHRLYVVESEGSDPLGPYHFKGKLAPPGSEEFWAIDPVLFRQAEGVYIAWSGAGSEGHNLIYIAPMSNPWTISGPRMYLASAGGCGEVREASAILQHGAKTFLFYSTCDTGKPDYQLWMQSIATNANPMVPSHWTQHSGAMFTRNDSTGVWGPGSNGFFKSPDGTEDWIVYHGKNTSEFTYHARTTRAQKIEWNADGTPSLGAPLAAGATQALPSGDPGSSNYWLNDTGSSNGPASVTYTGSFTAYPHCGVQCFWGNDHGTNQAGATATVTFEGTQIALLSARDKGNGFGAISVDGAPETKVDYYVSIRQGEQLVYVSPRVPFGKHTLTLRATGEKNAASTGASISFDRAEIYTR